MKKDKEKLNSDQVSLELIRAIFGDYDNPKPLRVKDVKKIVKKFPDLSSCSLKDYDDDREDLLMFNVEAMFEKHSRNFLGKSGNLYGCSPFVFPYKHFRSYRYGYEDAELNKKTSDYIKRYKEILQILVDHKFDLIDKKKGNRIFITSIPVFAYGNEDLTIKLIDDVVKKYKIPIYVKGEKNSIFLNMVSEWKYPACSSKCLEYLKKDLHLDIKKIFNETPISKLDKTSLAHYLVTSYGFIVNKNYYIQDIVEYLIKNNMIRDSKDKDHRLVLELTDNLIEGFEYIQSGFFSHPFRYDSYFTDYMNIVEKLMKKRIIKDVSVQNSEGKNILHILAEYPIYDRNYGLLRYINIFLSYLDAFNKIDINTQDNRGNTPLHDAIQSDNFVFANWLIDHGAKTNIKNKDGETVLDLLKESIEDLKEEYDDDLSDLPDNLYMYELKALRKRIEDTNKVRKRTHHER